jgi:putative N6-adenine-specific DNA methylase
MSLDTSGEDLFLRGQEKWVGEAPLRDTMAAALLQLSCQGIDDFSNWQLADPMMGSGTFLLEALQYNKKLERHFAFQNWFKSTGITLGDEGSSFQNVFGADMNPKNVEMAQKNLQNFKTEKIELVVEDVFKSKKHPSNLQRLVIVNPPYGKRLKINRPTFYTDLVNKMIESYQPERVGIIIPRGKVFTKPAQYEQVRYLEFSNNSIDVHFHVLTRF